MMPDLDEHQLTLKLGERFGTRIEGQMVAICVKHDGKDKFTQYFTFHRRHLMTVIRLLAHTGSMFEDKELENLHRQLQVIQHLEGNGN